MQIYRTDEDGEITIFVNNKGGFYIKKFIENWTLGTCQIVQKLNKRDRPATISHTLFLASYVLYKIIT